MDLHFTNLLIIVAVGFAAPLLASGARFVLMIGLVALATQLGLEVILGAVIAGAILTLVDRDEMTTHPEFRRKLEAAGFRRDQLRQRGCADRRRAAVGRAVPRRCADATQARPGHPGDDGFESGRDARRRGSCDVDRSVMETDQHSWDFSDLRAIYINCTLKRAPERSHTQGLADRSIGIMERNGVAVDVVRAIDHDIATGVWPDMTEHGWERDDWPAIFKKVIAADILVLTSPIWLGQKSSVCMQVIERLYGNSHLLNDAGQYAYYGRVGGCLITGNEDGIKHCAMEILYSLGHLGYTVPPQADAGWIGEAGPGPSYLDADSGGPDNDFTNRNTTFMTWNLLHLARMLKDAGGVPAHGNQRSEWEAGCRFDYENPEHR